MVCRDDAGWDNSAWDTGGSVEAGSSSVSSIGRRNGVSQVSKAARPAAHRPSVKDVTHLHSDIYLKISSSLIPIARESMGASAKRAATAEDVGLT